MTKEQAIDILIAIACCTDPEQPCEICPLRDDGCKWTYKLVNEAVRLLLEERRPDNERGVE